MADLPYEFQEDDKEFTIQGCNQLRVSADNMPFLTALAQDPSARWTPAHHIFFPGQDCIFTILLAAQRFQPCLPWELWKYHILPCFRKADFLNTSVSF
jgi:hypothetical protein